MRNNSGLAVGHRQLQVYAPPRRSPSFPSSFLCSPCGGYLFLFFCLALLTSPNPHRQQTQRVHPAARSPPTLSHSFLRHHSAPAASACARSRVAHPFYPPHPHPAAQPTGLAINLAAGGLSAVSSPSVGRPPFSMKQHTFFRSIHTQSDLITLVLQPAFYSCLFPSNRRS